MNDLISRQAIMKEFADFVRKSNNSDFAQTPTWNDAVSLVGSMPSAQPKQLTDVNKKGDLISRQALLRQIDIDADGEPGYYGDTWKFIDTIKMMPTAQPNACENTCEIERKSNDLISRQDAIDTVKKNTFRLTFAEEQNCEGHVAWSAEAVYSDVMEGALLDLPSAQPEIIHCKDCKYYTPVTAHCEIRGKGLYLIRGMEDFCSRAERRTDGQTD